MMKNLSEKMMGATGSHADGKICLARFIITYYACFLAGLIAEKAGAVWEME